MDKRIKVDFVTKLLSMHYYVSEVPVEGKITGKYFKRLGYNEHYVAQIIRTGNCITLLSTVIPITLDNFWNTNYLEAYIAKKFLNLLFQRKLVCIKKL